jgi:hypothetical protein
MGSVLVKLHLCALCVVQKPNYGAMRHLEGAALATEKTPC